MSDFFYTVAALFALTLLFTVVYAKALIPVLRRHRASQPILEIGPSWHLSKVGTPTLGGLAFIGGMGSALLLVSIALLFLEKNGEIRVPALIFCYALCCGAMRI